MDDLLKSITEIISSEEQTVRNQAVERFKLLIEDNALVAKKAKKASVLYIIKENTDYQCKDCPFFQQSQERCWLHHKDDVIKSYGSCGIWTHQAPLVQIQNLGQLGCFTKEETGYEENEAGFSCKRCEYYAGVQYKECKKVDEDSPGDTPGEIHPDACCNAWDKK